MTTQESRRLAHRTSVRALRPARVALILEVEYRRAQRDLERERLARRRSA
ncbi:hypothetical protein [Nocardioides sp. TF02-7]|nr:hypothetical protein [Nocardioides sp. TF02-7]UMG93551.1 hypothetical protein MF408_04980 [Nocardioides sp. TF02-7]